MGVGNWTPGVRHLPFENVHVGSVPKSFEDYCEEASQALDWYVRNSLPGLAAVADAASTKIDVEWAKDFPDSDVDDYLSDNFPSWDDQQRYGEEVSGELYDALLFSVPFAFAGMKGVETFDPKAQRLTGHKFDADPQATILARGRYAQVVLRSWADSYYLAIAPRNKLAGHDEFIGAECNKSTMDFVSKCWAACDPHNESFSSYRAADARLANVVVDVGPRDFKGEVDSDILGRVTRGVLAAAAEPLIALQALGADSADQLAIAKQAFEQEFGFSFELWQVQYSVKPFQEGSGSFVTPSAKTHPLEWHESFLENLNAPMDVVVQAYNAELAEMRGRLLDKLASIDMDLEPYRPDGAWTSKKVDMSPYLTVEVMQVDLSRFASALAGKNLLKDELPAGLALFDGNAPPAHAISVMNAAEFDRTVLGAVQNKFKVSRKLSDMHTVFFDADPKTGMLGNNAKAVLVWTGHKSWLINDGVRTLAAGSSISLDELPLWMSLVTDMDDIRATLDSLSMPAALAKSLLDSSGDLDVTGLVVEVGDGEDRTVYATTSSRPFAVVASYEPLLYNGQWVMDVDPAAAPGVSHG